jgi:hypothetical protein
MRSWFAYRARIVYGSGKFIDDALSVNPISA